MKHSVESPVKHVCTYENTELNVSIAGPSRTFMKCLPVYLYAGPGVYFGVRMSFVPLGHSKHRSTKPKGTYTCVNSVVRNFLNGISASV